MVQCLDDILDTNLRWLGSNPRNSILFLHFVKSQLNMQLCSFPSNLKSNHHIVKWVHASWRFFLLNYRLIGMNMKMIQIRETYLVEELVDDVDRVMNHFFTATKQYFVSSISCPSPKRNLSLLSVIRNRSET